MHASIRNWIDRGTLLTSFCSWRLRVVVFLLSSGELWGGAENFLDRSGNRQAAPAGSSRQQQAAAGRQEQEQEQQQAAAAANRKQEAASSKQQATSKQPAIPRSSSRDSGELWGGRRLWNNPILFLYRFIHYLYTGYTFSGEESFCLPGSTEISLAIQSFTLKPEKICRHGKIVGTSWPMNANLYVFVGSI